MFETPFCYLFMFHVGGAELTISGYGFKSGATVDIGTESCDVVDVSPDEILCTIPSSVSSTESVVCELIMLVAGLDIYGRLGVGEGGGI